MLIVAALAACSSSDSSASEDAADAAVEVAPPASVLVASPLEAALGFASDPEVRQYQVIALQRGADDAMVQCMGRAGFFYAVRPAEDVYRSGAFAGDGSREWTIQNGLGITSSFVDALATDAVQDAADPADSNLEYVSSLTEQQAIDYDLALVGEITGDDPTAEYSPGGCFAESFTDVLRLLAMVDEFEPGLATLNSRLNADPRVVRFQSTWSACMQSAGYRYFNQNALVDDVYARLLDIELVDQQGITQVASSEALDELVAYEQAAAMASFDCRLDFADELARLRYDYEQEFLDDHRFRVAELLGPGS